MKATLVIEAEDFGTLLSWLLDSPEGIKLLDARMGDKIPRVVAEDLTETHENSPSVAQDRVCLSDEADIRDYLNRAPGHRSLDITYESVITGATKDYRVRLISLHNDSTITVRDLSADALKTFYISGIKHLDGPAL